MTDQWAQSEGERVTANLIRVGVITELDAVNARVKVKVGGLDTDWLPWTAQRAGATRSWSAPRPGEQVVVLSPYGDTAQGIVLPGLFQDDHPAPETTQDMDTVVFPDGSKVTHNSAASEYLVDVIAAGKITLKCSGVSLVVSSSGVAITGGSVTHNGVNIGKDHVHSGVQSGGSNTGVPV